MGQSVSITSNQGYPDKGGNRTYTLILQERDWQMNIWMTEAELAIIPNVKTARWSKRTCLEIGTCQGIQTFWSCENDCLSILVGDPEGWNFGIMIARAEIEN